MPWPAAAAPRGAARGPDPCAGQRLSARARVARRARGPCTCADGARLSPRPRLRARLPWPPPRTALANSTTSAPNQINPKPYTLAAGGVERAHGGPRPERRGAAPLRRQRRRAAARHRRGPGRNVGARRHSVQVSAGMAAHLARGCHYVAAATALPVPWLRCRLTPAGVAPPTNAPQDAAHRAAELRPRAARRRQPRPRGAGPRSARVGARPRALAAALAAAVAGPILECSGFIRSMPRCDHKA